MKWTTALPVALSAISLVPGTAAWRITWRDADDNKHFRTGHGPSECIEIDNAEGHYFNIDAQGDKNIKMQLFDNSECSGNAAGSATQKFTKKASRDLLGFKVISLSSTTASESAETTATVNSANRDAGTSHTATATHTASVSSSRHAKSTTVKESTTIKASPTTTPAASKTPEGSSDASSAASSSAPATTTNAAVHLGANGNAAMGMVGGIMGAAIMPWII
ncbi:hypothetical protein N7492_001316 [Penicillium capsulatum]|uniref:Uncharacterized protein n=1 Tax=Penicillium capsulatum TaxID=69766 RepID=A0A9W9LZS8_9EURO|nr:hypothetical protein N7492_001316 [Penicillium capsulatum]KAJ6129625.1 hypothetical protein N7512_002405 [Penicillium capsulatum]